MREILERTIVTRTTEDWMSTLVQHDVWCAPVNDYAAVTTDPQVQHNRTFVSFDHPKAGSVRATRTPIRMTQTPARVRRPPPLLGEHTDEVLREVGYSDEELEELHLIGAVG